MQIGLDLGGTKTEAIALDAYTVAVAPRRTATPRDSAGTLDTIVSLVAEVEAETGCTGTVGVGIPGVALADVRWKYVNVGRVLIFVEHSIEGGDFIKPPGLVDRLIPLS
jgi:predicted NBD/HSP70 family sugar kinase